LIPNDLDEISDSIYPGNNEIQGLSGVSGVNFNEPNKNVHDQDLDQDFLGKKSGSGLDLINAYQELEKDEGDEISNLSKKFYKIKLI
jgi:hypothetical protein